MEIIKCQLRFLSPAFMGDAFQNGAWRTPPIKALLRQWWRVVYAKEHDFQFDIADMRHREGLLFGHAWLEGDRQDGDKVSARKSAVRLRLVHASTEDQSAWTQGTQQGVAPLPTGLATSYAWYGLVDRGSGQADKSAVSADKTNESIRELQLAVPDEHAEEIRKALFLIDCFGALGSRSRGGWGSVQLEGREKLPRLNLVNLSRDIDECLKSDWAMSLGWDYGGLMLWEDSERHPGWDRVMERTARLRKNIRSALKDKDKSWASALGFAGGGRMPSTLRWKVCQDERSRYYAMAYAMPHAIPSMNNKHLSSGDLWRAWGVIADIMDKNLVRVSE